MADEPRVTRNDEASRYELWLGEERAGTLAFGHDADAWC
jgi:hypothetical protein